MKWLKIIHLMSNFKSKWYKKKSVRVFWNGQLMSLLKHFNEAKRAFQIF